MKNILLFPLHRKARFLFLATAAVLCIEHFLKAVNSSYLTGHMEHMPKAENSSFAPPITRSLQQGKQQQQQQQQLADGSSSNLSVGEDTLETSFNLILDRWHNLAAETYAIYPKLFSCAEPAAQDEITITVHLGVTPEKFRRLLLVQRRWDGPISVAMLIKSQEEILELFVFLNDYAEQLTRTTVHVMMEKTAAQYPHNSLREIALQNIDSDYYLTLDVDFVTNNPHAHAQLHHLLQTNEKVVQALRNNTMMVLPAFNLEQQLKEEQIVVGDDQYLPANKSQAMEWVQTGNITEFHGQVFFAGHGPTNYTHWYRDLEEEPFYPIQYGFKFEPYVLGYKRNVPHFWEGFRGFGYNKYSWFVEAFYMDFKFAVLRDFFVVHLDHPIADKDISLSSLKQMDRFKAYLQQKYRVHHDDLELIQSKGNKILKMLDKEEHVRQQELQTRKNTAAGFKPKVVEDEHLVKPNRTPLREPSKGIVLLPPVKTTATHKNTTITDTKTSNLRKGSNKESDDTDKNSKAAYTAKTPTKEGGGSTGKKKGKPVTTQMTQAEQEEKKRKREERFENRAGIRAARPEKLARKKEQETLNSA